MDRSSIATLIILSHPKSLFGELMARQDHPSVANLKAHVSVKVLHGHSMFAIQSIIIIMSNHSV